MYDPTFRQGRASDRLHAGPPPLLRAQLDAYVDLLEASFDVALTRGQEIALRDALEVEYETLDAQGRRDLANLVAPLASVRARARAGEVEAVPAALGAFRRAVDARLTASPDTQVQRLVRQALARPLEVVWAGNPPVTAPAADAWIELVAFLTSVGRNEASRPTDGQRAVVRRGLQPALVHVPGPVRARLRTVHRTWLRLKAAWDAADVTRRTRLRWEAMGLLAHLLPQERRITVETSGDLETYARASALLRPAWPGYESWSNAATHPKEVFEVLDAWLGPTEPANDHVLLYR